MIIAIQPEIIFDSESMERCCALDIDIMDKVCASLT
jgi:hypothetical protein